MANANFIKEVIITKDGEKAFRPGLVTEYQVVAKYEHSNRDIANVVKQPNGFYGVIVTDEGKTTIIGSTQNNHSESDANAVAKYYSANKTVGMKSGSWFHGSVSTIA